MSTLLDDAFAHHDWATERIIDVCSPLTNEQLAAPVPGAYSSMIETLPGPRNGSPGRPHPTPPPDIAMMQQSLITGRK